MLHLRDRGLYEVQLGSINRDHVNLALKEFPGLEMCDICRPWGRPGIERPTPS